MVGGTTLALREAHVCVLKHLQVFVKRPSVQSKKVVPAPQLVLQLAAVSVAPLVVAKGVSSHLKPTKQVALCRCLRGKGKQEYGFTHADTHDLVTKCINKTTAGLPVTQIFLPRLQVPVQRGLILFATTP